MPPIGTTFLNHDPTREDAARGEIYGTRVLFGGDSPDGAETATHNDRSLDDALAFINNLHGLRVGEIHVEFNWAHYGANGSYIETRSGYMVRTLRPSDTLSSIRRLMQLYIDDMMTERYSYKARLIGGAVTYQSGSSQGIQFEEGGGDLYSQNSVQANTDPRLSIAMYREHWDSDICTQNAGSNGPDVPSVAGLDFRRGAGTDFRRVAGPDFRRGGGPDFRRVAGPDFLDCESPDVSSVTGPDFHVAAGLDVPDVARSDVIGVTSTDLQRDAGLGILGVARSDVQLYAIPDVAGPDFERCASLNVPDVAGPGFQRDAGVHVPDVVGSDFQRRASLNVPDVAGPGFQCNAGVDVSGVAGPNVLGVAFPDSELDAGSDGVGVLEEAFHNVGLNLQRTLDHSQPCVVLLLRSVLGRDMRWLHTASTHEILSRVRDRKATSAEDVGVRVDELLSFCTRMRVFATALGADGRVFAKVVHPGRNHLPHLCFLVMNNHIYKAPLPSISRGCNRLDRHSRSRLRYEVLIPRDLISLSEMELLSTWCSALQSDFAGATTSKSPKLCVRRVANASECVEAVVNVAYAAKMLGNRNSDELLSVIVPMSCIKWLWRDTMRATRTTLQRGVTLRCSCSVRQFELHEVPVHGNRDSLEVFWLSRRLGVDFSPSVSIGSFARSVFVNEIAELEQLPTGSAIQSMGELLKLQQGLVARAPACPEAVAQAAYCGRASRRHAPFCGRMRSLASSTRYTSFDVRACYARALSEGTRRHTHDRFSVTSVFDFVERFTQRDALSLAPGRYYVVGLASFPFPGEGWYHAAYVDFLREIGWPVEIEYQMLATITIQTSRFKQAIESVSGRLMTAGPPPFGVPVRPDKRIINAFIGTLAGKDPMRVHSRSCRYSRQPTRRRDVAVSPSFEDTQPLSGLHEQLAGEPALFACFEQSWCECPRADWLPCLYEQVIECAWVAVYDLCVLLRSPIPPLAVKTDCVFVEVLDDADAVELCASMSERYREDESAEIPTYLWQPSGEDLGCSATISEDSEDNECELTSQGRMFIGRAGTGKTHCARAHVEGLSLPDETVCKVGPTRKAAAAVGGITMHALFRRNDPRCFDLAPSPVELARVSRHYKLIWMDECFMCTHWMWLALLLLRVKYGITIVLSGDPDQLRPVCEPWLPAPGRISFSPLVLAMVSCASLLDDTNTVRLTNPMRADASLFSLCERIVQATNTQTLRSVIAHVMSLQQQQCRLVRLQGDLRYQNLTRARHLSFWHSRRKQVNARCMLAHAPRGVRRFVVLVSDPNSSSDGAAEERSRKSRRRPVLGSARVVKTLEEARRVVAPYSGDPSSCEWMIVCAGTPIVASGVGRGSALASSGCLRTNVTRVSEAGARLSEQRDLVPWSRFFEWYEPAFCATIHSTQCETIEQLVVVHDAMAIARLKDFDLARRLLYVALSRARRMRQICLIE